MTRSRVAENSAARDLIEPGDRRQPFTVLLPAHMNTFWVVIRMPPVRSWRRAASSCSTGPMDREWGMRTASFTDPDGHIWEVAQELAE